MIHNVLSSLIYNSQNLERTQMSFNRAMDTYNMAYLYNGVLPSYKKTMTLWILRQMDGCTKYHPELGNSITKEHTWYALTEKWILAQSLEYSRYNSQTTWSSKWWKTKMWILWSFLGREMGNEILKGGNSEINVEQRLKKRPYRDCHTWGSILYTI